MRPGIFDVLREGEDIVPHALNRLYRDGQSAGAALHRLLAGHRHVQGPRRAGDLCASDRAPWMLWERPHRDRPSEPVDACGLDCGVRLRSVVVSRRPPGRHRNRRGRPAARARRRGSGLRVRYVLFSGARRATPRRGRRGRRSCPAADLTFDLHDLPDGRLPGHWNEVKEIIQDAAGGAADLVLAPSRRRPPGPSACWASSPRRLPRPARPALRDPEVGRRPGSAEPVRTADDDVAPRKVELLNAAFPSQKAHDWWDDEVFLGLMRLRGMECRSRYAEAFDCAKAVVALPIAGAGQSLNRDLVRRRRRRVIAYRGRLRRRRRLVNRLPWPAPHASPARRPAARRRRRARAAHDRSRRGTTGW